MDTVTQSGLILKLLKKHPEGVENWKLVQCSLKYSSRISELRKDGHNIVAERVWNGKRATGTWKYKLIEETQPERPKGLRKFLGFKKKG